MTTVHCATPEETRRLLQQLGVDPARYDGGTLEVRSPIDGQAIARLPELTAEQARARVADARQAFLAWRKVPAPRRGELVRLLGEELRAAKAELGRLVSIETGKILSEGEGEVQEMIDICDFATGLSRQLYGLTIATERAEHRMMETWHPAGPVAIISAFNFPVAVWAWNAAIALVCGDSLLWKPSEKAPLTALATQALLERALARFGDAPAHLSQVLIGGREVGEALVDDARIPIVSATGSTAMGRKVGPKVAERFGRSILELGGNNAAIICPSANLDLALRGIAFSAMGTAGQRCTSLRRIFVHEQIADDLVARLKQVYESVAIGDPRDSGTLIGPLRDQAAFDAMQRSLADARAAGGRVTGGAREPVGGPRPGLLRAAGPGRDAGPERGGRARDLRAHPVRDALPRPGRGHRAAERRAAGAVVVDLHQRPARGRAFRVGRGLGLRHRQRQHRAFGRGDRRGIRRREGDRRRARGRLRQLEGVHAPHHQYGELWQCAAAGAGREVRRGLTGKPAP
ncbi:aldehyde dehydrogenase (NAD) family protein [Bordetella bronchiseptica OSU553]|nr:aldehyde dehydrogenase (NAD) family protein [Bordetella bronchiseptica OSU553]